MMPPTGEQGGALLLVVGATAAMSALGLAALTASLMSYEIADLEHDGVQARLLAESALGIIAVELSNGAISTPAPGLGVVWNGSLPAPPPGFAGLATDCGWSVRLTTVPGTPGPRRLRARGSAGALLVDAEAAGWCGRGYAAARTRFAMRSDGVAVRLY